MCYEIEFANRTFELDEIRRPGGPKFILVDAPAGYGKSYLLRRVKEDFEARGDWGIVLVDLKSHPGMSDSQVGVARAAIANEIANQVGAGVIADSHMDRDTVSFAINNILQGQARKLLLLLDSIEVLSAAASDWLRSMLGDLDHAMQIALRELRVVLAGRYVRDWGRKAGFSLRRLELSPFDLAIIRPIVYDALTQSQLVQNINQAFVSAMATYTQWISGGHPQGICGIVSEIAALNIIPPNLKFFFFDRVFETNGHSGTMFGLYVEPILDTILDPVPMAVREALENVSTFRKFNPDVLDILISDGEISGFESGWELLKELMKTCLVNAPSLANPMYSDEVVRRMLDIRMRIRDPKRYEKLNKRAKDIFHTWALGQQLEGLPKHGGLDTQVMIVCIVESLYHMLALRPHAVGLPLGGRARIEGENGAAIIKQIGQYQANISDPAVVVRLKAALAEDQELYELICSRAGERGYSQLLDMVEGFMLEPSGHAMDPGHQADRGMRSAN